jgi:hypothetical protein
MKFRHRLWRILLKFPSKLKISKWSQGKLLKTESSHLETKPFGYRHREFLESCLTKDFKPKESKRVTACIVSSVQEIELLPLSTTAILTSQEKSVDNCFMVAPRAEIKQIQKVIPGEFTLIADEDLLSAELQQFIDENFPKVRRGWIKQQVLKILAAKLLGAHGTLLVDADTILLRPQIWLSTEGIQNLHTSIEYHAPYQRHYERFMSSRNYNPNIATHSPRVSFVTHHQLMQQDILEELFGEDLESFQNGLKSWLEYIDFSDTDSPACEWHTYGTFISSNFSNRIQLTQWSNLGMSRNSIFKKTGKKIMDVSVDDLMTEFGHANSLSLHHYINP